MNKKIGVFGTCRIDNYNIHDFKQIRKEYPYTYKNKLYDIYIRPLGYTTTSSDILQNLQLIVNNKYKIEDNFLYRNVLLKHGGKIIIPEKKYDYLVLEICSIKKIIHIKSNFIIPYEIEGKHNKNHFKIETESFEETVNNIIKIRDLMKCKIILLPPITTFNGKTIKGVHENIIPNKVMNYRNDIINRLKKASNNDNIDFINWNNIIKNQGINKMLKDQFHFTDYGKKYISNFIYKYIISKKIFFKNEQIMINIPYDNDKRHRYYKMYQHRDNCEVSLRLLVKYLYKNNFLDKTKNIIDLGAWIGDNTIPWALKINGIVYAIDPSKENINYINELMNINNIFNVKTINNCISNKEEILYTSNDIKHAQFNNKKGKTSIKTTTLDKLLKNKIIDNVSFIHLDVEGLEQKVLDGSINLIKKFNPIVIWENHLDIDNYNKTIKWFANLKYKTFLINEYFPHCKKSCRNFISFYDTNIPNIEKINTIFSNFSNINFADKSNKILIEL